MNLRTRRAMDLVQSRDVPEAQEEIERYLGHPLALEIEWETFASTDENTVFSVNGLGLKKVAGAMLIASGEEFVKKAIAEALQSVHFRYVGASADKAISIDGDALHLAINFADPYEGAFSDQEIYDFLMDSL